MRYRSRLIFTKSFKPRSSLASRANDALARGACTRLPSLSFFRARCSRFSFTIYVTRRESRIDSSDRPSKIENRMTFLLAEQR